MRKLPIIATALAATAVGVLYSLPAQANAMAPRGCPWPNRASDAAIAAGGNAVGGLRFQLPNRQIVTVTNSTPLMVAVYASERGRLIGVCGRIWSGPVIDGPFDKPGLK